MTAPTTPVLAFVGSQAELARVSSEFQRNAAVQREAALRALAFAQEMVAQVPVVMVEGAMRRIEAGLPRTQEDRALAFERFCRSVHRALGTTTLGPAEVASLVVGAGIVMGSLEVLLTVLSRETDKLPEHPPRG